MVYSIQAHIAHDIKMGRFPKRSTREEYEAETQTRAPPVAPNDAADQALQQISLLLGGSDEWADQASMIADVIDLVKTAVPSGEAVAQAYRAGFKAGKVWAEPAAIAAPSGEEMNVHVWFDFLTTEQNTEINDRIDAAINAALRKAQTEEETT